MSVTRQDVVAHILSSAGNNGTDAARAYAPANIALCKYWGKRNTELNLPVTGSLSLSLGAFGSHVRLARHAAGQDRVTHNGDTLAPETPFVRSLATYLDLFRDGRYFDIETRNTIPTAAGFASSASGFAALARCLNALMGWELSDQHLSVLARLGSGSASRSVYDGLVEWRPGTAEDGLDSYAVPLADQWPELRIGLLVLTDQAKPIGSRAAMQHTIESSPLYSVWPGTVDEDLATIKSAILDRDFTRLGVAAEGNAMAMHATMIAARPSVIYWTPDSVATIARVRAARETGLDLYLTMDAGPNVKLLFLAGDEAKVAAHFPDMLVADAFAAVD